ncbi:hypothetical protein FACS1894189_8530 [Planctomycetales bacterium]|nr:hypothetical protein FACS1894189_8530 [Planctomycetales bacterium]
MAKWYYYDKSGDKIGLIRGRDISAGCKITQPPVCRVHKNLAGVVFSTKRHKKCCMIKIISPNTHFAYYQCKNLSGLCYNDVNETLRHGSPMNTITPRSETEAFLLEKFQSLLTNLDTAGDNAQYGHVLDDMDDYLFLHGRRFLTEILQSKIQERINAAEQTDAAKQCPHCKKNGSPQNEDENINDEQQSHQDFPPSSPL